jgi:hypothetical protein
VSNETGSVIELTRNVEYVLFANGDVAQLGATVTMGTLEPFGLALRGTPRAGPCTGPCTGRGRGAPPRPFRAPGAAGPVPQQQRIQKRRAIRPAPGRGNNEA